VYIKYKMSVRIIGPNVKINADWTHGLILEMKSALILADMERTIIDAIHSGVHSIYSTINTQ